jgi:uncharacterized protein (TIGR03437 family)
MREIDRTRFVRADRRGVYRGFSGLLIVTLCLFFSVAGTSSLPKLDSQASAVQNAAETSTRSAIKLSGPVSVDQALGKSERSEGDLWRAREVGIKKSGAGREFYRTVTLNEVAQRKLLSHAPMEFTKGARQTPLVMTLPMPDGTLARFRVEESPVMEAQLAARSLDIRTYRGRGLDDPSATTRFDVTRTGFHAIVLSSKGTVIIEPASQGRPGQYVSYDPSQAPKDAGSFSCVLLGAEQSLAQSKQLPREGDLNLGVSSGTTLRTYRLALAATAEFTQTYGGGTVNGALSAMATMMNAVNAIYERDLSIRLVLINNEASIIFTNPATDGYTSDDVNSLLTQNQTVLDQRIGAGNYDLGMVLDGHVFAFQPGHFIFQGAAQFQSTCTNAKGKAATILRSTEPSTTAAIWVAAHELAHLLGALHTFNGTLDDCGPSRFAQVAYEPGSGSTIMGYRGGVLPDGSYFPLCDFEDLRSTDTYFHTASIEQISNYTSFANGSFCGVTTDTGNNPPNVDAGLDYTIPANTPFSLTATGNDLDADALTYCWEEFDLGAAGPPHTDNGNRPIFRSFAPVPSPTRIFPQLSDILSGTPTFGESLPTTTRTMNFRVTVRDNHSGGGGVNTAAMRVNVASSSGPFVVTQPNSATAWPAGSNQIVTWNVANSSNAPVNCAGVRVLLSVDGGSSFPVTLASDIPNNGTATLNIPNTPTPSARIKVEAIGNIFFSISLPNFTITPNITTAPTLLTEENTNRAIALDSVTFMRDAFQLTKLFNFSLDQRTRVMLFAVGLELMPGEDISVVTAQAEDSTHKIYPLTVEYVGKVHSFDVFTQVNVRLPDGIAGAGDVLVSVSLRGAVSNKVLIGVQ